MKKLASSDRRWYRIFIMDNNELENILYPIYLVCGIKTVICNILKITYLYRVSKRTTNNRNFNVSAALLFNLASCNTIIGVCTLSLKAPVRFIDTGDSENTIQVLETILGFVLRMSMVFHIMALVLLTFFQYKAIPNPIQTRSTVRRTQIMVISVVLWILTAVLVPVQHIIFNSLMAIHSPILRCCLLKLSLLVIPVLIFFIFTYVKIIIAIQRSAQSLAEMEKPELGKTRPGNSLGTTQHPNGKRNMPLFRARKKSLKVFRIALATVIVFVVCWSPLTMLAVIKPFGWIHKGLIAKLENTAFCAALWNSALTSTVFLLFNYKKIYNEFKRKQITQPNWTLQP